MGEMKKTLPEGWPYSEDSYLSTEEDSALDKQEGGGHYKDMVIQPVEFCHANGIPFIEGCAIKYLCRWKDKGGVDDLRKCLHFVEMLIELEE